MTDPEYLREVPLDDIEPWITAWRNAVNNAGRWKLAMERAQQKIVDRLPDDGHDVVGTVRGVPVVRCHIERRTRFDTFRFKKEHDELVGEYSYQTERWRLKLPLPHQDTEILTSTKDVA